MNVCLDFLPNMLYNGKRILCKFCALPRLAFRAQAVFVALLLTIARIPASASDSAIAPITLSLRTEACGEDLVALSLVKDGGGFCGLLLEVGYPEGLAPLRVEKGDIIGKTDLTWIEKGGSIRLLLDGEENLCADGVLAVLWFSVAEARASVLAFSLSCTDGAVLSCDTCSFLPVNALTYGAVCRRRPCADQEIRFSTIAENGTIRLTVDASACLGAGVRVCLADMSAGELTEYITAGVTASDGVFATEITVPQTGCVCLILQPVGYRRAGVLLGETRVYCFVNGAFIG